MRKGKVRYDKKFDESINYHHVITMSKSSEEMRFRLHTISYIVKNYDLTIGAVG